jgi:PAS domain S-box-containing protein
MLAFGITATKGPLATWVAVGAVAVFGALLAAQQWFVWSTLRSMARGQRDTATLQSRLDAAAVASGGWLYVLDKDSRFVYSSEASADCLGYLPDELIGTEARALLSNEAERHVDVLPEDETTGVSTIVVRGRHRDGQDRWFECTMAPVVTVSSPERIGWSGVARPVTDGKHPAMLREIHRRGVSDVLRTGELVIAFQPIVDLLTGRTIGVEALSRFPSRTTVTPDVVFAEATNAGLGLDLELLAIRHALGEAHLLDPALYVAVNVSPAVLANASLADAMHASGIDLSRIVIEITEHASVLDYTVLERPRQRLRDLGVRLAIDDAGAGYSSLRHIVTLAPDIIKLDRTLVADIDSDRARRALVMAVVMFGREIGATTIVAEGVETPAELAALKILQVDAAQGFFLGRPTTSAGDWLHWQDGRRVTQQ